MASNANESQLKSVVITTVTDPLCSRNAVNIIKVSPTVSAKYQIPFNNRIIWLSSDNAFAGRVSTSTHDDKLPANSLL